MADEVAKAAASKEAGRAPSLTTALTPLVEAPPPRNTEKEKDWAITEEATLTEN